MLTVHRPCDTLFGSMPRYHVLRVDGPIPAGGLRAVLRLHGASKEIGPIENGVATFTFTDEEVAGFPPGLAYGRLDLTSPQGEVLSSMRFCAQVLITPPAPGPEVITADFGETLMPEGDFATKADATLTPTAWAYGPWEYDGLPQGVTLELGWSAEESLWAVTVHNGPDSEGWYFGSDGVYTPDGENAVGLEIVLYHGAGTTETATVTATRTAAATAYRLGPEDGLNPGAPIPGPAAIPAVIPPAADAEAEGKAADAKATAELLAEKVSIDADGNVDISRIDGTPTDYDVAEIGAEFYEDGLLTHGSGTYFIHRDFTKTSSWEEDEASGQLRLLGANGSHTLASGANTSTKGLYTHAEGYASFAEGEETHAEGHYTTASDNYTHAEGVSRADGYYTHAEGSSTALGQETHAEGSATRAEGFYTHAEGRGTHAQNMSEHAQGRCNKTNKKSEAFGDSGNTLHSIGIGTSESSRANAVEVMQDGKVFIKGVGGYDGTNPTGQPNAATDLATELGGKRDYADLSYFPPQDWASIEWTVHLVLYPGTADEYVVDATIPWREEISAWAGYAGTGSSNILTVAKDGGVNPTFTLDLNGTTVHSWKGWSATASSDDPPFSMTATASGYTEADSLALLTDIPAEIPVYDGLNHDYISASDAGSPLSDFNAVGTHSWTCPRRALVYVRLSKTSTSSSVVTIGVNGSDNAHTISKVSQFKSQSVVVPVFLNAGDQLYLTIETDPITYVLFSAFYLA